VLDAFPLGTTSPVYAIVGGAPVRSAEDARYFVAWVDRLIQGAQRHTGWNSDAERDGSLATLRRAREEFVRRSTMP
jgi:hypothetical protein